MKIIRIIIVNLIIVALGVGAVAVIDGTLRAKRKVTVAAQRGLAAEQLRESIQSYLGVRFGALIALKSYYESLSEVKTREFSTFAEGITKQVSGFLAIQYIDQNGFIREIYPLEENKESKSLNISEIRESAAPMKRSEKEGKLAVSVSMDIRRHGVGFMAFIPVNKGKARVGWVAGVFEVETIVSEAFIKALRQQYYMRLLDQNGRIISMGPGEFPEEFTSRKIQIGDTNWEMRFAFKEGAVKEGAYTGHFVWGMGLIFVAALVLFATVIQVQNVRLHRTNAALSVANKKVRDLEAQRQEAIVANMADGIIVADTDNRIVLINEAAKKIFNTGDAAQGKEFVPLFDRYALSVPIDAAVRNAEPVVAEMVSRESEALVFSVLMTRLKDSDGADAGCVVSVRNITEMRLVENMKSEFIMMTSHKLKTPLAVVKSTISLFRDGIMGALTDKQLSALNKSYAQIEHQEGLINKLLDYAAIEKKSLKMSLSKERFDVSAVVDEAVAGLASHIAEKGISVEKALVPGIGTIIADRARVKQLIHNLLDNAVKFNPKGTAVCVSDAIENGKLKIEVVDNGVGIPAHELAHIFDSFKQVDKFKTGQVKGIGLGLMIARHIAMAHDGDIQCYSEEGKGTRFIVTLATL
ncbi:MAG TPA: ATP-binding protein [bacterium]|nr:ATP-binding protein [bacterium]